MIKSLSGSLIVLAAFLAHPATAVAEPIQPPLQNYVYYCEYETPAGYGTSQFVLQTIRVDLRRGTELFTLNGVADQRKVTFAKPVVKPDGSTQWEFTVNPGGPQCKDARVYYQGAYLVFRECTDGQVRNCF